MSTDMSEKEIKTRPVRTRMPKDVLVESEITDIEVAKKMIKILQSAVDRKLEFNLSFLSVKKLLSFKKCFYTNKDFVEEPSGNLLARSFDRIDSSKGYVEGNVVACTIDINQKKANLSFEEIEILYTKIKEKINS